MLLPIRLVLLPIVLIILMADVIAMSEIVAAVITTEADVIAFLFFGVWLMLLPILCNVVAGVIAKWQML